MSATRLLSVMLTLVRTSRTTVAALASAHDCSPRTIQRDLAALAELGVPVVSAPGPTGGVGVMEGWRSPVTAMTGLELQALLLGAHAAGDLGLAAEHAIARLKMLAAAPYAACATGNAGPRSAASAPELPAAAAPEAVAGRVQIDPSQWFSAPEHPESLPAVAEAVLTGRRLCARYRRGQEGRADEGMRQLMLDPLGLVLKTDRWYLVAVRSDCVRTFRLARLAVAEVVDEPVRRPAGFDLAEYWAESTAAFEADRHRMEVRLRLPASSADALTAHVPGAATTAALGAAGEPDAEGRLDVVLPMERVDIALAQLLPVPGVEVLEPDELRTALIDRARAVLAAHADDPGDSPAG